MRARVQAEDVPGDGDDNDPDPGGDTPQGLAGTTATGTGPRIRFGSEPPPSGPGRGGSRKKQVDSGDAYE